jgi:hypothetical protein
MQRSQAYSSQAQMELTLLLLPHYSLDTWQCSAGSLGSGLDYGQLRPPQYPYIKLKALLNFKGKLTAVRQSPILVYLSNPPLTPGLSSLWYWTPPWTLILYDFPTTMFEDSSTLTHLPRGLSGGRRGTYP